MLKLRYKATILFVLITGFCVPVAYLQEQTIGLFPMNLEVFDLMPGQETVERIFQVESGNDVDIFIVSSSSTLDVSLLDPSGNIFPNGATNQFIKESYTIPDRNQAATGITYLFHLKSAPPGAWKCRVRETITLTGPRGVVVHVSSSSPIRTGLLVASNTFVAGIPITLSVISTNEESVLKLPEVGSVLGFIGRISDGSFPPLPVTFLDNGLGQDAEANDGIFTVSPVLGPGEYSLFGIVNGTTQSNQPFTRNFSGRFSVISDSASYAGSFREQVKDLDGNGLPEVRQIEVDIRLYDRWNPSAQRLFPSSISYSP